MERFISVAVPVYNAEKTLKPCIESILNQTYRSFELLLIDDGSTDNSLAVCHQFEKSDNRVRCVEKDNGGVSSARNEGIKIAKGSYIAFCDSDDYLQPDYLERLVALKNAHPEVNNIWCRFRTVAAYGTAIIEPYPTEVEVLRFNRQSYMNTHGLWLDTSVCTKLYDMRILQKSNITFDTRLSLGEDWMFNLAYLDACDSGEILVVNKPLYNYCRGRSDSLDTNYRANYIEIMDKLHNECLSYLQKWQAPAEQLQLLADCKYYAYEKSLSMLMRTPELSRKERIKLCNSFLKSEAFRTVLANRECFVHPLYLQAYRKGNYKYVMLLDNLVNLKHIMRKPDRSDV